MSESTKRRELKMDIGKAVSLSKEQAAASSVAVNASVISEVRATSFRAGELNAESKAKKVSALNGAKGAAKKQEKYETLKNWVIQNYIENEAAYQNKTGKEVGKLLKNAALEFDQNRRTISPDNLEDRLTIWINAYRAKTKVKKMP